MQTKSVSASQSKSVQSDHIKKMIQQNQSRMKLK